MPGSSRVPAPLASRDVLDLAAMRSGVNDQQVMLRQDRRLSSEVASWSSLLRSASLTGASGLLRPPRRRRCPVAFRPLGWLSHPLAKGASPETSIDRDRPVWRRDRAERCRARSPAHNRSVHGRTRAAAEYVRATPESPNEISCNRRRRMRNGDRRHASYVSNRSLTPHPRTSRPDAPPASTYSRP